ncbi:hypothetical protein FHS27_006586 [Rhodopirellula rubra]|uniref:Uncharacterized protein n=1 Tax=Aporhodopirellula rubra TaxID=980271 RepID=A0A7W5E5Y8_9BACT|nr:hypothetical protein [Aporhodopirellula rubra]MBB3210738.1 hypothetical protein [Aporhodopirellula rubra]
MKIPRYTISTVLLLSAIAALGIALVQSQMRTASLQKEINSLTPLRELDIAAQVEDATAESGVPATVQSLAFDPTGPTYLVSYAYHAPDSGTPQTSSFLLTYKGDGKYVGHMRTGPYLDAEPDENGEFGTAIVVWDREITNVLDQRPHD